MSPFTSRLEYIKDVPFKAANQVLPLLNNAGPIFEAQNLKPWQLAPPEQLGYQSDIIAPQLPTQDSLFLGAAQTPLLQPTPDLVPGYTTKDDAGDDGDDTLHAPISFYKIPNCIQSTLSMPENGDPETVDLVFVDFIQPWILTALRFVGQTYNTSQVEPYREEIFTDLMADWIKENWKKNCRK